jgi:hypothetical protein
MSLLPINFKKRLFIFPFAWIISFSVTVPKAHAMEPVTMAILAPILMPYAQRAAGSMFKEFNPQQLQQVAAYAAKGCSRTVPGWINAGSQLFNIFRLPLGASQLTLGVPFGFLDYGIENTWKGGLAPFLMGKEILCMPLYFFGVI